MQLVSNCQEPPAPNPPMILRLEGLKLGLRTLYSCPIGYSIEGIANATCLASGEHVYYQSTNRIHYFEYLTFL